MFSNPFHSQLLSVDKHALDKFKRLFYVFLVVYVLALAARPSPYRRLYFIPLLALAIYGAALSSGSPLLDYFLGNFLFITLFGASDWILLTDVQRELYFLNAKEGQQQQIAADSSFRERVSWALRLLGNPRGVGWAHEARHASPARPPPTTKPWTFVFSQLLTALFAVLLAEAMNLFNQAHTPSLYANRDGPGLAGPGSGTSLGERYANVLLFAVPFVAWSLIIPGSLSDAVSVATGSMHPQDCPPATGSLEKLFTLRNFWGRVWHQQNRRFLASHGRFFAHRILRLPRGTYLSAYTQLFVAFFVSGMMHYIPEYMTLRNWGGGALRFFLMQALAILVEDRVLALGRQVVGSANTRRWKLLGYLWVWTWFAWTLPGWVDPLARTGLNWPRSLPEKNAAQNTLLGLLGLEHGSCANTTDRFPPYGEVSVEPR
ncbi:hypothetical protein HMN09_01236900 [Mycena chlorophos]|uniref:Wax synthase domain-containing protein n=1 Tax=Mycena chlorophos TaxID=658473 RepID=A0A8H6S3R1_MYCCL|nr:hypothetical protein HMN09_01236900 [Mycena chlorophos]